MSGRDKSAPRRFVALAVEVAADEATQTAGGASGPHTGRTGQPAAMTASSTLSFSRFADGHLRRVSMRSFDARAGTEADALTALDRHLGRQYFLGAKLVVFDAAATLGTLARRARRHWLYDEFDFERWSSGAPGAVFDALEGWDPGDTLADVCAAMGIRGADARHRLATSLATEDASEMVPGAVRRAEVSAVATALLMAHDLAAQAKSPVPLLKTWCDLMSFVRGQLPRLAHCASFRCDGLVDPDVYSIVGAPVPRARRRRP